MTKISSTESFFISSSKFTKTRFRTPLGSLPRSPRPFSRMGRWISDPLSLKGYGFSDLSQLINYYLARERKFQGTKVLGTFAPGSESSRERSSWERKFLELSLPGAKVQYHGTFAPGSESSQERKFLLPAIRSADPENPSLEPNMEWIGCTVCEIVAFKNILWPWNWDSESLKVIENGSIRYSTYDFIFVFHSNYASISSLTVSEI